MKKQIVKYEPISIGEYRGVIASSHIHQVRNCLPELDCHKCVASKGDRRVVLAQNILFKQSARRPWEYFFKNRARKEFFFYQKLEALNIKTAFPVGLLESRKECFFMVEALGKDCEFCLKKLIEENISAKILSFLQALAHFINDLINNGFFHGDLKLANIVYDNQFYVIDLTDVYLCFPDNRSIKIQYYS